MNNTLTITYCYFPALTEEKTEVQKALRNVCKITAKNWQRRDLNSVWLVPKSKDLTIKL